MRELLGCMQGMYPGRLVVSLSLRCIFDSLRFTIDDTGLISALRDGDPAAFETIYHHFVRPLRYFVEQLITDRPAAEDITIETFSKAFNRHRDFVTIDKLKSFLFTTAHHASLDWIKMQKRHERSHQEIKYLSSGEMEDSELLYIRTEVTRIMYEAIEALPGQTREVIRMAFVEGKRLGEIAQEMKLSYNTVQNYRARGLELLRNQLIKNKLLSLHCLLVTLSILEKNYF